jgi:hypothetical protein
MICGDHHLPQCSAAEVRELTFAESVRTYGASVAGTGAEADVDVSVGGREGRPWDGGEDEAEDDELQGVATLLKGHQAGWTLMDRVYVFNGSLYVVT